MCFKNFKSISLEDYSYLYSVCTFFKYSMRERLQSISASLMNRKLYLCAISILIRYPVGGRTLFRHGRSSVLHLYEDH